MKTEADTTALWSIGTAVPDYRIDQAEMLKLLLDYHQPPADLARLLKFVYRRSQIESRYTCCPEIYAPLLTAAAAEDPSEWSKLTTQQRMQVYETEAVELAQAAAQNAIQAQSTFTPDDITHLIIVTCTGFVAPGPDLLLLDRLELRPDTRRLQVGFMGCNAALHGLQTADAICRSDADAVALVICVELCTLHFQPTPTEENLIITSLFSDGAAATLVSQSASRNESPLCHIDQFASRVFPQTRDSISWRIEDHGFHMGLAMSNAKDLRPILPDFMNPLLSSTDWTKDDIRGWAVHPGGRAILDTCERALELSPDALSSSRAILREYGNMSSPTVLFVMQRLLDMPPTDCDRGLTLAFGPGISLEGMLWSRG